MYVSMCSQDEDEIVIDGQTKFQNLRNITTSLSLLDTINQGKDLPLSSMTSSNTASTECETLELEW